MIVTILLCTGCSILAMEGWSFAKRKWPARAQQIRSEVQPLVSTVEKEAHVISDALSAKLSVLGAAISNAKTEAANQKTRADAAEAALASANAHIADLTNQLAVVQQNHADDVNAVSALADQAAAG